MAEHPATAPRTLVLDLDGTLCLGDAPIRAMLHRALVSVPSAERASLQDLAERFLDGDHDVVPDARDGYQAVSHLMRGAGVDHTAMSAAFMDTRADFRAWLPQVHAPEKLRDVLAQMTGIRKVLATNSPAVGMTEILDAIGVLSMLDDVITDAAKPLGMPTILDQLGVPDSTDAFFLAGIGDIWENDLAEIHRRGGATFHITDDAPDSLAEALRDWANAAQPSVTA